MREQLARGSFIGFSSLEDPFADPNGMNENIRRWDDHIGLYTMSAPVPPGTPFPIDIIDGQGQIYTNGTYATFNGGTWKTYEARRGVRATLASGTDEWINTGAAWIQYSEHLAGQVTAEAVEIVTPILEAAQTSAYTALGAANGYQSVPTALSAGVTGYANLVAGSGGTDGTFAIAFSGGGGTGAAGKFVVNAGKVVAIQLQARGSGYTSAPAMSFAASSGLTGASATAVIGDLVPDGGMFSTPSSADNDAAILYQRVGSAAVEKSRLPSSERVTAFQDAASLRNEQPNLFTAAQVAFDDLSNWTRTVPPTVEIKHGRRALRVANGSAVARFLASAFDDTGRISASLQVKDLADPTVLSRLRISQRGQAGVSLGYSESYCGTAPFTERRYFEVQDVERLAGCHDVEFIVQTAITAGGGTVWITEPMIGSGSNAKFRSPPAQSEMIYAKLPNRYPDAGFKTGDLPTLRAGTAVLDAISDTFLTGLGAVRGFRPTGTASANVQVRLAIPTDVVGKFVVMSAYGYSADGQWPTGTVNSLYLAANGATEVTTGLSHRTVAISANVRLFLSWGKIPSNAAYLVIGKQGLQESGVTNRLVTGLGYFVSDSFIQPRDVAYDVLYPAKDIPVPAVDPTTANDAKRAIGLTYDQPNRFSPDELAFDDLSQWQSSVAITRSIKNGRRVLTVHGGAAYRDFPRSYFEEMGRASGSLIVEELIGATANSRFLIEQIDAAGAPITAARGTKLFGTTDFSLPKDPFEIAGLGLHPDAVKLRFWVQSGITNSASEVSFREMLMAEGSNPKYRNPPAAASGGAGALAGTITLKNSDKVCQLGDSYTQAVYPLKDKHPAAKVAELADWRIESFGFSGYDCIELNDVLLSNVNRYGTTFADINPSQTIIISETNDNFTRGVSWRMWQADMQRLVQSVMAFGSRAAIASEHPKSWGSVELAQFKAVADRMGIDFVDVASDAQKFEFATTQFLWDGSSHPGTRTNSVLWAPILEYVNTLPRPRTSLRLFRPRPAFSAAVPADLVYDTNDERATIWKELTTGHMGLKLASSSKYDAIAAGPNPQVEADRQYYDSEYIALQKNIAVAFNRFALVEVILPALARDTGRVKLNVTGGVAAIYALNRRAAPGFSTLRGRGFVGASAAATIGDTYSDGTTAFTVAGNYGSMIVMTSTATSPNVAGTLTRVSGTGPASITYTGTSNAFDPAYYDRYAAPKGAWEAVAGGQITGSSIAKYMQEDRVVFLLEAAGDFNLTDVSVEYEASAGKPAQVRTARSRATGSELLAQTNVGEPAELAAWTVTGSLNGVAPAAGSGDPPAGTTKCVRINDSAYIAQAIALPTPRPQPIEIEVTVWCRRWEPLFDPDADISTSPITADTYDNATLELYLGRATDDLAHSARVVCPVGLGYIEVKRRFHIGSEYVRPADGNTRRLTVKGADSRLIEIYRVSARAI